MPISDLSDKIISQRCLYSISDYYL